MLEYYLFELCYRIHFSLNQFNNHAKLKRSRGKKKTQVHLSD